MSIYKTIREHFKATLSAIGNQSSDHLDLVLEKPSSKSYILKSKEESNKKHMRSSEKLKRQHKWAQNPGMGT